MTSYGDSWRVTEIQWRLTRESYTVYCQAVLMTMFDKWQSWHYNGLRMFHTRMVLSVTGLTLQDTVEIAQVWQLTNDNDCHDICVMQHQTFSHQRVIHTQSACLCWSDAPIDEASQRFGQWHCYALSPWCHQCPTVRIPALVPNQATLSQCPASQSSLLYPDNLNQSTQYSVSHSMWSWLPWLLHSYANTPWVCDIYA